MIRCVTRTRSHQDCYQRCQPRAQRTKCYSTSEPAVTIYGVADTTPPFLVERVQICVGPSGSTHDKTQNVMYIVFVRANK